VSVRILKKKQYSKQNLSILVKLSIIYHKSMYAQQWGCAQCKKYSPFFLVTLQPNKCSISSSWKKGGKVKTYDLEVKNPLKWPPIGVKKKSLEVIPHYWWKKKSLEVTPHWWPKKKDLKCLEKDHLNWSLMRWSDPPSAMKRKWLELSHLTCKWKNGLWENISLKGT
jgi:hypothetical protein